MVAKTSKNEAIATAAGFTQSAVVTEIFTFTPPAASKAIP